jgi:hypothetical protein
MRRYTAATYVDLRSAELRAFLGALSKSFEPVGRVRTPLGET